MTSRLAMLSSVLELICSLTWTLHLGLFKGGEDGGGGLGEEVGLLLGCDEAGFSLLLDAAGWVADVEAGLLVVGRGAGPPVFPGRGGFVAVDEGFKLGTV
jgi:hypothetical protein